MKINNIPAKEFSIVRPHYNSSFLTEVQIEALKKICYGKDARETVDDVGEAPAKYEIVVGNTNRSGSLAIDDYDSFSVRIEGDKVYLNGGSPYATAAAVKSFAKLLKSHSVTDADSFCGSYKEYEKTVDRKLEYTPRWIDDFDGDSVDTSKWYLINEEYTGKGPDGLSGKNGKRAFRSSSPDVTYIKNGCFNVNFSQDEHNYYGGTLRAYEKLQFKYGYMETSAKLPKGSGFWNTLWLSSIQKDLRILPEIDVNESFGSAAEVRANVHIWPNAKLKEEGHAHHSFDDLKQGGRTFACPDSKLFCDDFHTFGVLWTDHSISFTGDGRIYCTLDLAVDPDFVEAFATTKMYPILSGTPGFSNCPWPQSATEEEWKNTNKYIVDYVHLYQLDDGVSELTTE